MKNHTKLQIQQPARIFTVGHSNRSIRDFIELLKAYKLKLVIDVRTIPKSRHNPQFGEKRLANSLAKAGIEYIWMSGLGGLRPTSKDSVNKAWRNKSFRGYADYMQTEEFKKNLKKLINKSKRKRLTIMCAEAVPWRCHRSLVADALLVHGYPAEEIFSKTNHRPHRLTPFAQVRGKNITYPADEADASAERPRTKLKLEVGGNLRRAELPRHSI
jgi:uncharacterized protein (DUF488 family)